MPTNTMQNPKAKGDSTKSVQERINDIVLRKLTALEAKVEQLQQQVSKLQGKLQEKNGQVMPAVPQQANPTVPQAPKKKRAKSPVKAAVLQTDSTSQSLPETPKKQRATSPVKAAVLQKDSKSQGVPETPKKKRAKSPAKSAVFRENSKPEDVPESQCDRSPSKLLEEQRQSELLIDIMPKNLDVEPSPVLHTKHKKADVTSSSAFVRVSGPMGSCQMGTISNSVDHIPSIQLDIDTRNTACLWISSLLAIEDVEGCSANDRVDDDAILEIGAAFRSAQILPDSLQFGRVVDTLLLPPAILDQLEDPNEVPSNLYYATWKYHGCAADGFASFLSTQAGVYENDRTMKLYRQLLGHRQTVQVWFMTEAEHVDDTFEWLKARCYRGLAREWQPCSGHKGNHDEYCQGMGKNRKGVAQFLRQSASTL